MPVEINAFPVDDLQRRACRGIDLPEAAEPRRGGEVSQATLKELFVRSGGRCAVPECAAALISMDGKFVGHLVPIESANSAHPRYCGLARSGEDAQIANLLLTCERHYMDVLDLLRYPADVLRTIKCSHEVQFRNIAETLQKYSMSLGHAWPPQWHRIAAIHATLGWPQDWSSIAERADAVAKLEDRLRRIDVDARELFQFLVLHGRKTGRGHVLSLDRLRNLSGLSHRIFYERLSALALHGLVEHARRGSRVGEGAVVLPEARDGFCVAREIRSFSTKKRIRMASILIDLRFEQLGSSVPDGFHRDGPPRMLVLPPVPRT